MTKNGAIFIMIQFIMELAIGDHMNGPSIKNVEQIGPGNVDGAGRIGNVANVEKKHLNIYSLLLN